jgi:hypothetical protein
MGTGEHHTTIKYTYEVVSVVGVSYTLAVTHLTRRRPISFNIARLAGHYKLIIT